MQNYTDAQIIAQLEQQGKTLFTLDDFARLFTVKKRNTLYKIVQRLAQRQTITPLTKGRYALSTALAAQKISPYQIANFLYQPSYVSLETALFAYSIMTGFSYAITSVSLKPTTDLTVQDQEYSYSQLTPQLFWGYQKQGYRKQGYQKQSQQQQQQQQPGQRDNYLMATPEKALLDYLYLASKGLRSAELDEFDLTSLDSQRFKKYLDQAQKPRLKKFVSRTLDRIPSRIPNHILGRIPSPTPNLKELSP